MDLQFFFLMGGRGGSERFLSIFVGKRVIEGVLTTSKVLRSKGWMLLSLPWKDGTEVRSACCIYLYGL